ncbi:hypothetical protein [Saccharibacillus deserti]|uniref:hypothetical protein n=1 Tax=Saccharibacillus deserti TaxID=1634444 RepID=UPI0015543CA6|nr:hypothetical protein [Saccharibacillus deserti]
MRVSLEGMGGLLFLAVPVAVLCVIGYFIAKTAFGNSRVTNEIYSLRMDLSELERRQTERFTVRDAHLQEQNALLREQNEHMRRAGDGVGVGHGN